ncbi:MFS transporter [Flavobacterium aquicola]|uniref:Fucose permease n=1 Tax=Flavobacterium aquicola TaxID=1682742 RepID=A0A3E0EAL8_9FLAO|nr:MFS transporter [Flavobacterium aquicola]REG94793.1 fucose permease [Flavobacterium aquicola]
MQKKQSVFQLLPILLGFFIMGFVDVVGIATNYVKKDFQLSDAVANLLPMAVFLWFLIFSIPIGMLMNKIGRKKTVLLSMLITVVALLIPMIAYSLPVVLIAFALLGIGNTIIQVSLNPLLTNIITGEKLTSTLTLGQFVKAIASFLGPVIAAFCANTFGNWQLLFIVFAVVTILSALWLWVTYIPKEEAVAVVSTFGESFALLGDKTIFLFFIGILTLVGIDVGLNITAPRLMMERAGMALEDAGYATSLYFIFRTAGAFLGAIILSKMSAKKFYIGSSAAAILAIALLMSANSQSLLYTGIALAGFACANMFSIIFSYALKKLPSKSNEVSALMIMGVSGGALFPFLMGVMTDAMGGIQIGAVGIILICCVCQLFLALSVKE